MHRSTSLAAVSALAIALTACGSAEEERAAPAEPVENPGTAATPAATTMPTGDAGDAPDGDASPMPSPSASATPTPGPGATATRTATPTPTPIAVVTPPVAFTQCGVCHSVERGENGIGPTLAGVFGRRSASVAGFNYSPAMREAGLTWNQANLNRYLGDPSGVVPGTTMALPGVPANERTAIINYLKTL